MGGKVLVRICTMLYPMIVQRQWSRPTQVLRLSLRICKVIAYSLLQFVIFLKLFFG